MMALLLRPPKGRKASSNCIVIPAGKGTEMLDEHLRLLSRQTTRDFDVLVVGEPPSKVPQGVNVLVCRENLPVGSSGGFGLGQVQAYLLGYESIISADLDCFPISENLVEKLIKISKSTGKAVFPLSLFDRSYDPKTSPKNHIVNHYGTIPRAVLERHGFANFRFYKGGEDVEEQKRLEMESCVVCEPSVHVEHKNKECNHIEAMNAKGNKYLYYSKNFVIASIYLAAYSLRRMRIAQSFLGAFLAIYSLMLYRLVYWEHPDLVSAAYSDGLALKMGKVYCSRPDKEYWAEEKPGSRGVKLFIDGEEGSGIAFKPKSWIIKNKKGAALPYLLSIAGKIAFSSANYVQPSRKFLDDYKFFIMYLLLLKPTKYIDGRVYGAKTGLLRLAANAAVSLALFPFIAIAVFAMVARCLAEHDNPVTTSNLASSLGKFHQYLLSFEKQCRKTPA